MHHHVFSLGKTLSSRASTSTHKYGMEQMSWPRVIGSFQGHLIIVHHDRPLSSSEPPKQGNSGDGTPGKETCILPPDSHQRVSDLKLLWVFQKDKKSHWIWRLKRQVCLREWEKKKIPWSRDIVGIFPPNCLLS